MYATLRNSNEGMNGFIMVGIEHAILGGDQSEGVSSLTGASSLSTTR